MTRSLHPALARAMDLVGTHADQEPPLVIGRPWGGSWWSLAEAVARATDWFPALVEQEGDRRTAATYLASGLAEAPSLVVGLCAVFEAAIPQLAPDRLWLHRHAGGRFERHAIDPVDVHTGAVDEVLSLAGTHITELTAPIVEHVCASLPVGPAAVWGSVADSLGGYALYVARERGLDELETWRRCELLVDAITTHTPSLRHRPRLFPVTWSGGVAHYQVRGTCCLYHRTVAQPDPDGDGYCATCPLRTDGSRTRRLRAHLQTSS